MTNEPNTRTIEQEYRIDAPVEAVWKALTDAEELTNWFPLEARVRPGAGGSIWTSWKNEYAWDMPIEIWEPNRHLRTIWGESGPDASGDDASAPIRLVVDYFLESREGGTVLRLVHSGFSADASWDEQYDGTRRGWRFELTGLRHYLEHHRGVPRRAIYVRENVEDLSAERAWAILMTVLNGSESLEGVKPGDAYQLVTATGDAWRGRLATFQAPRELTATVENLNNAWMRADQHACSGPRELTIWISTYGVPEAQVASLEARLQTAVKELIAAESVAPSG